MVKLQIGRCRLSIKNRKQCLKNTRASGNRGGTERRQLVKVVIDLLVSSHRVHPSEELLQGDW